MRSKDRERLTAQLEVAQGRVGELEAELQRIQARDPLVAALLTLPAFRAQLDLDVKRAQRYERPLSLAVIDVDRFRQVNHRQGYAAGDRVLVAVGTLLAESTRIHDLACRSGADEFALLLPETDAEGALVLVNRLIVALEDAQAGEVRGISVSAGIAGLRREQSGDDLLADAAAALSQARSEGGGRASIAGPVNGTAPSPDSQGGSNADVVLALAQALEERDRYTGEHSESVVDLTARVGESLALQSDEIALIRTAALLHDIGKVGIPDGILHKPGPLDEREWEIMRQHPAIGERILRALPGMGSIARIVRHEHERWDGGGYPDGLAGEAIPIGARIILACDAYHAMTSDRPYRRAMSHRDAMAELTGNAGTQFDPRVVEALVGYLFGRRQSGLAAV